MLCWLLPATVPVASVLAANDDPAPEPIDRQSVVSRHNPVLRAVDARSPLTVGNGRFAFTADVTGLQSFADHYFENGTPLETKARWAWHSEPNPGEYTLDNASSTLPAYGRQVRFPVDAEVPAGQWLRRNPHDLPLARIAFLLDGEPLRMPQLSEVRQELDLWRGQLESRYRLQGREVRVSSLVHPERDQLVVDVESDLLLDGRLTIGIRLPSGYDPDTKNTPSVEFGEATARDAGKAYSVTPDTVIVPREINASTWYLAISSGGEATLERDEHDGLHLVAEQVSHLSISFEWFRVQPDQWPGAPDSAAVRARSAAAWQAFWQSGGIVDFSGSADPRAGELERRVILSRYLLQVQSRATIPAQETGLTSSSWYGKHHTEMTWWHTAHWMLWNQPEEVERVLDWFLAKLDSARALARSRGLDGARWAKMVGPDNRESPGGNPLIIWNQPQVIHLAEMLYALTRDSRLLEKYGTLVDETAATMASMLVQDRSTGRYNLDPPVWIAQEIYDPAKTRNPAFELAYWRYGLAVALDWRERRGLGDAPAWRENIRGLADLPVKDGRYVAIESQPDTFDNIESRQDHPTMLAPYGLLNDPRVDTSVMQSTLAAVLNSWDFETKIWGWDYPMIAMTAARLGKADGAIDILLADAPHNRYLANGHCPQEGALLPVYLPANGALLSAVAMLVAGWPGAPDRQAPGFPDDGRWQVRAEGLHPLPY